MFKGLFPGSAHSIYPILAESTASVPVLPLSGTAWTRHRCCVADGFGIADICLALNFFLLFYNPTEKQTNHCVHTAGYISRNNLTKGKILSLNVRHKHIRTAAGDQRCFFSCCCRPPLLAQAFVRLLDSPNPHQYCKVVPKEVVTREGNMEGMREQSILQEIWMYPVLIGPLLFLCLLSQQCIRVDTSKHSHT